MFKSRFSKAREPRKKVGWEGEAGSYNDLVGERGHYYHREVVVPGSLKLLNVEGNSSVLDLGCGQGVFARSLPKTTSYVGVDSAKSLIDLAKKFDQNPHHRFEVLSATRPLKGIRKDFSHAVCILALQNMEYGGHTVKNASEHLSPGGKFLIVLNHPSFRIPRQTGWGERENKLQYRWINSYMSFLKIPIDMHPGQRIKQTTMSYHHPLSTYTQWLFQNGFVIEKMEEWCSNKQSEGKNAKMENRGRSEIPLFLAILAKKV